jgi:hypothetical protein
VINLALKESMNAIKNEDEIATNLGIEYIHIAIRCTNLSTFLDGLSSIARHFTRSQMLDSLPQ